jgi:hypothetical protein
MLAWGEDTFPVFNAGSQIYSNVTVTSKTSRYVVISHARGMTSLKLKDLPIDTLKQLGYEVEEPKPQKSLAERMALDPRITDMQQQVTEQIQERIQQMDPQMVRIVLGSLVFLYLFFCYCCMLICHKVGQSPGIWVWIPVLQLFPLLRAAGMSAWWFLLGILVSPVVGIVWCVRICRARGKSLWLALCLLLPITDLFAFLYLAFADEAANRRNSNRITFE